MARYSVTVTQRLANGPEVQAAGASRATSTETKLDLVAGDVRDAVKVALASEAFNQALGRVQSLHVYELSA